MARIVYILLCHKDPDAIVRQAEELTAAGDYVAIHFDASASAKDHKSLVAALAANPSVVFTKKRVSCGWGEWSLVQATLNTLRTGLQACPEATHFYMVSGDCMPIKTARYAHRFLDENDADFIENSDFFNSDWIKTGLKQERLIYRHYFNERTSRAAFYRSLDLQRKLGLDRKLPQDMNFRIGSQWWCLRRHTVEALLAFIAKRRDIPRLFATTWIPDETFFQTLVPHIVPTEQIRSHTLTFLMFSDYGMPVTFYNDHHDMLLAQNHLFARKISPEAKHLKRRLGSLYAGADVAVPITGNGSEQYRFLAGRGRIGQRFARRFWDDAATARDADLLVVLCSKRIVGKRLIERIRAHCDLAAIGYLFSDPDTPLPDLGGIETSLEKRTRHRRTLVSLLFDRLGADRLVICIDPENIAHVRDFTSGTSSARVLDVTCSHSDQDLRARAVQAGLVHMADTEQRFDSVRTALRNTIANDAKGVRDLGLSQLYCLAETAEPVQNARALAAFLDVLEALALDIIGGNTLFTD